MALLEPQTLHQAQLQLSSDLNDVGRLLDWLNQLDPAPLSAQEWLQCQIAIVEGFTNVVRHAHRQLPIDTPITLEIIGSDTSVEMCLWDYGPPFDLEGYLAHLPPMSSLEASQGRGLQIMRRIADRLEYQRVGDRQNHLKMIKYIASAREQSEFCTSSL
jgi:serine/threonine-protein kinase RsbW